MEEESSEAAASQPIAPVFEPPPAELVPWLQEEPEALSEPEPEPLPEQARVESVPGPLTVRQSGPSWSAG